MTKNNCVKYITRYTEQCSTISQMAGIAPKKAPKGAHFHQDPF